MRLSWIFKSLAFAALMLGSVSAGPGVCQIPQAEQAAAETVRQHSPIESLWQGEVLDALGRADLFAAERALDRLVTLRDEQGFSSLGVYSFYLLERARESLPAGEIAAAGFYVRQALRLSPASAKVVYSALPLVYQTRAGDVLELLGELLNGIWGDQGALVAIANRLILPVLLSMAVAMYLCLLMTLGLDLVVVLRRFARDLPLVLRGALGPPVLTAALCLPCLFGVMWSIFLWSLTVLIFLPRRKWLGFYSGALLVLWAVLLPIRSNFSLWLGDPGVSVVLSQLSGDFWPGGGALMPALAKRRAGDALPQVAAGMAARRSGNHAQSTQYFREAQNVLGDHPWLSAQMGISEMLRGDYRRAQEHFDQAEDAGLDSAAFFFNYSKLKYQMLDSVGGMEYFDRAQKADSKLTALLQKREERLGVKSAAALAPMPVPSRWIWRSALEANSGVMATSDAVSRAVMPQVRPYTMFILGAILIVLFLLRKDVAHAARIETYYTAYRSSPLMSVIFRLLPGGGFLMGGKAGQAFFVLSFVILALSPLVASLNGFQTLLDVALEWKVFYMTLTLLAFLLVIVAGAGSAEKGK